MCIILICFVFFRLITDKKTGILVRFGSIIIFRCVPDTLQRRFTKRIRLTV